MRTTVPEATEPVSPPGLQRLFRFGAWCFIVVGATHLLLTGLDALGAPDPAAQRALDAMAGVPTTLPGIRSDMAQLYQGFAVAMALLGLGFGLLNLVVLRLAPGILGRGTALLWVDAGVSALLLAVAVFAFPTPPILATAAALAAYGWALAITRRGRARAASALFEGRST
jgi:dipeptide/tripeptide permease